MTVLGIHASKRAPQSGSQEREKLLEHARLVLAVTGHVLLQALEHGLGMSNTFQKLHRHPDASVRSHLLPLHLPLRNVPPLRQRKIILKIIEVKKQPVLEARLRGRKMYAGMLLHKLERLVKAFMAVAIKDQPALGRGGGRLLETPGTCRHIHSIARAGFFTGQTEMTAFFPERPISLQKSCK